MNAALALSHDSRPFTKTVFGDQPFVDGQQAVSVSRGGISRSGPLSRAGPPAPSHQTRRPDERARRVAANANRRIRIRRSSRSSSIGPEIQTRQRTLASLLGFPPDRLTATWRSLLKTVKQQDSLRRKKMLQRTDSLSRGMFSAISGGERVSRHRRALPSGHSRQSRHAPTFRNVLLVAVKRLTSSADCLARPARRSNDGDRSGRRPQSLRHRVAGRRPDVFASAAGAAH